ncbi:MAG TPA: WG repeat-containing protein, partial [Rhodocyclaceae bacterium]|nr:WG repeat-containing protein [Rhodocyclaceae bacterium]
MGALKFLVVALVVFGAGAVGAADKEPALFQIRQGDAIGLIDRTGKVVVPAEFREAPVVGDPLIRVQKGTRTAYYAHDGTLAIPPQEELTQPFTEGLAPALLKDDAGKRLWGYV